MPHGVPTLELVVCHGDGLPAGALRRAELDEMPGEHSSPMAISCHRRLLQLILVGQAMIGIAVLPNPISLGRGVRVNIGR